MVVKNCLLPNTAAFMELRVPTGDVESWQRLRSATTTHGTARRLSAFVLSVRSSATDGALPLPRRLEQPVRGRAGIHIAAVVPPSAEDGAVRTGATLP